MNRIITDSASAIKGQPLIADSGIGSIPFLQDAVAESIWSMLVGLIGTYTANDIIVIEGVVITLSNSNNTATWTKGAIGYNGEVYTVDAGTVTKTGGQLFVYQLLNSFSGTLDPVIMSDNTSASVHQVRKITILAGASGSGIADYNATTVKPLNGWNSSNVTTGASVNTVFGGTSTVSSLFRAWKRDYNSCTISFTCIITTTSLSGKNFEVVIPLPFPSVGATYGSGTVIFTKSSGLGDVFPLYSNAGSGTFSIAFFYDSLSGSIASLYPTDAQVVGQITYRI